MKLTIDTNDVQILTLKEVAKRLFDSGAFMLDRDENEEIGEVRLECGCDLEIDIFHKIEGDPRCNGYVDHTETFTLSEIEFYFDAADYYTWAKDEDGNDVLACFGC